MIGYRVWHINVGGELTSTARRFEHWWDVHRQASCMRRYVMPLNKTERPEYKPADEHPDGEIAPAEGCTCGYHAWLDLARAEKMAEERVRHFMMPDGPVICGMVEAWGKIVIHDTGFRAEYMRPLALLERGSPDSPERAQIVSDRYLIPILNRLDLLEYATQLEATS